MDAMDDLLVNDDKEKERKASGFSSSSSPFGAVLAYWKDFDLETERSKLDEQGLKIGENQESSLKNRRKLAESTRDFKKVNNEEKVKLMPGLLKGYQEEVDNLTKRAKYGETAFLSIYQKLFEAPDPVPVLASASVSSSRVSELETENRKMRQELEEFRTEAAHLKNQQATLRRLEERNRQLEQQMEEKVKELVEMKQKNLAEENQKILEVLKEREAALQDQLRTAHESVQNMQRLHEFGQSQLFELRAQSEEDREAKQAELTLLSDEVERAQSRLLSLEREKDRLRSQLQAADSQQENLKERPDTDMTSTLEASLEAKEKMISDLHSELRNLESAMSNERDEHLAEIRKLNAAMNEKENALKELQKELSERPTMKQVDDLRKKVKILQAVGYNLIETEDWDAAAEGQEISKLESLLLEKNRKLEHELTQVKVQLSEKISALDAAEQRIKENAAEIDRQAKLIAKLEDDILKGYNSADRKANKIDDWELPDSGISGLLEPGHASHATGNENQNSMLEVICNQRDRFRQRLREAEEELRQARDKNALLLSDLEKCKTDNVKLYEKIRYIQDYTKERPASRGAKKKADDLEAGMMSDAESKYKKLYEDDINPFAAFSKKERERRYKDLGIRDKITLRSGRFLLSNKYARTFVFFYSIGLHLLVFASLYRFSSVSYHNVSKEPAFRMTIMNSNSSQFSPPNNPSKIV